MKKHIVLLSVPLMLLIACSGADPTPIPFGEVAAPTFDAGKADTYIPAVDAAPVVDASVEDTATCQSEDDASFCGRNGKQCGPFAALDNCGTPKSVANCGNCATTELCSINTCKSAAAPCVPNTDAELCLALGKKCGAVSVPFDNCGKPRQIADCGVCVAPELCSIGAVANLCCLPETDAAFCARTGTTCGSGAGVDNCGQPRNVVSCGACVSPNALCDLNTHTCKACVPNTDLNVCIGAGYQCGVLDTIDNCGQARHVSDCGGIPGNKLCDYSCTPTHQCCQSYPNATLCSMAGRNCGAFNTVDACGIPKAIASCGVCVAPSICSASGVCGP